MLVIFAITVAGLVLRLLGARGDLWLDEIWSFVLLEPITSVDQIFWHINHDNNHFLNSIYLYLVGPDVSPVLQRGLSIALGAATIVTAGVAAAARGRSTAVATALLFATSYPMVHYGSEARGYAGLVLFTVLSVTFLERRLDQRDSGIAFAVMVLLGFLSHLTMMETVAVLVVWTGWLVWRRTGSLGTTNAEVGLIFTSSFMAVLPLAACVLVGRLLFGFRVGGASPFSVQAFATGYGGMIRYLFGLPSWIGDWVCIVAACGLVCACACIWRDRRSSLYVIGVVGLPFLMAAAHLPNLEFPRYFLVSATFLLLWCGELFGRVLDSGGRYRLLAVTGLVAILIGNASSLLQFYQYGRGSYSMMVARVTQDGDNTYASNHDFHTGMVVDHFARQTGHRASLVKDYRICSDHPAWLILEDTADTQFPDIQPADCAVKYVRTYATANWGLSGLRWALYRRQD